MKSFAVFTILFFQVAISPLAKMLTGVKKTCRFSPSCSEYVKGAIVRFGVGRGFFLGIKRIGRCHPFGGCGVDLLPNF